MKNNQIVLPLVLSLIFVLSLSGLVFYFQSQITTLKSAKMTPIPTPTSTWQTYKNEKYGFEFKYPSTLKLSVKNNIPTLQHSIPYKNYGDCDMSGLTNREYDSFEDFNISFEIKPKNFHTYDYFDGDYKNGDISGKYSYSGAEGCGFTEYYLNYGDKTLLVRKNSVQAFSGISTYWNEQLDKILAIPGVISSTESSQLFDQILSTFKFTTPTSSVDYSDWRTYEKDNIYAYIQKIYSEDGYVYVDADYTQFLDCNDSVRCPNGFSIKNDNKSIRKLKVSPSVQVFIYQNYQRSDDNISLSKISIDDYIKNTLIPAYSRLMRLSLANNVIMGMMEQYIP